MHLSLMLCAKFDEISLTTFAVVVKKLLAYSTFLWTWCTFSYDSEFSCTHYIHCNSSSLSLSLCFNGHFPGEPGLASVYQSKG